MESPHQVFDKLESKVIALIGSARTGSSYIATSLCTTLQENIVYLGELFHPDRREPKYQHWSGDEQVLELMRKKTGTKNNQNLYRKIKEQPANAIRYFVEAYEKLYGEKIFVLKIFEQHVPQDSLKELFSTFDAAIFLKRNFFDSYVSLKIAQDLGKWLRVDTSKSKIKLDYSEMMQTYAVRVEWECEANRICSELGTPIYLVEYESFHAKGRAEIQKHIELFDIVCDLSGIDKKQRDYQKLNLQNYKMILKKQNKNKNILDSIEEEHKERFIHFLERWKYDVK